MNKWETLQKVKEGVIVLIVRADDEEKAQSIVEACYNGGIRTVEITYTVPGATDIIKKLNKTYKDNILVGAGTVLDPETARLAIIAGAKFIVTPSINPETIKLCNRYQVPCIAGISSIKDAIEAMELGVDILKVFPGEVLGPKFIKAIKGPLPYANLMPTGGISEENIKEWLEAGAIALGIGSQLTSVAKNGDYEALRIKTQKIMQIVGTAKV